MARDLPSSVQARPLCLAHVVDEADGFGLRHVGLLRQPCHRCVEFERHFPVRGVRPALVLRAEHLARCLGDRTPTNLLRLAPHAVAVTVEMRSVPVAAGRNIGVAVGSGICAVFVRCGVGQSHRTDAHTDGARKQRSAGAAEALDLLSYRHEWGEGFLPADLSGSLLASKLRAVRRC